MSASDSFRFSVSLPFFALRQRSTHMPKLFSPILLLLSVLSLLTGCESKAQIQTHVVPKQALIDAGNQVTDKTPALPADHPPISTSRTSPPTASQEEGPFTMLAAIIPHNGTAWFYKLAASQADLQDLTAPFEKLVTTTQFKDDQPQLELPSTWTQSEPSGMRFATITIPHNNKSLELSIISLPMSEEWQNYALLNVNRWRGQVGLEPVTPDVLFSDDTENSAKTLKTSVEDALYVKLTGPKNPNASSMNAPFMNR